LKIRGEYTLEIKHSLLSVEKNILKINKIYSLAQPYFQCQNYIQERLSKAEWVQVSSSAHAIEMCKENPEASVAIGYADTGIEMGLNVMSENIQDLSNNETRFIILSKKEDNLPTSLSRSENIKTSLVFTLADEPGKLLEILNIFRNYSLNLCHIESRPTRLKEWRYYFFLTVECDKNQNMIKQALEEIKSITPWFNNLGSYSLLL
jgi:prephenate dehydratase